MAGYPGESDETFPEPFTNAPPFRPGPLSKEQVTRYFEKGWLQVDDFFSKDELEACLEGIAEEVDQLANILHRIGKIKNLHDNEDVFHRLGKIQEEYPEANLLLIKAGVMPKAIRKLWSSKKALDAAEQILGTANISGHPVWNIRFKVPNNTETTVPWHQDSAYLDNSSYQTHILNAWIPLLDTNTTNGCLQVISEGHHSGRVAPHTIAWENTWYVDLTAQKMEEILGVNLERDLKTLPVPFGGVLFFNNIIPHRSLHNKSDVCRWTMDLRWMRSDDEIGFYGLDASTNMRSDSGDVKIDWSKFDKATLEDIVMSMATDKECTDFDTTVHGPWFGKWEMTNTNRHTEAWKENRVTGLKTSWVGEQK